MTGNILTACGYLCHLRQSLAGAECSFAFFMLLWKRFCENRFAVSRGMQMCVCLVVVCSHSVIDWGVGCSMFTFCSH